MLHMRIGLHLLRRGRTYFFRCRLPRDIAATACRQEVVRTLNTRQPMVARLRAAALAVGLNDLWSRLRAVVTKEEIEQALDSWFEKEVARTFLPFGNDTFATALAPDGCSREEALAIKHEATIQDAEGKIDQLAEARTRGDYFAGRADAQAVISRLSEPVRPGDQAYEVICKAVMEAMGQIQEARLKWATGNPEYEPTRRGKPPSAPDAVRADAAGNETDDGPSLAEQVGTYLKLKRVEGRQNARGIKQLGSELRVMLDALGDTTPVRSITKKEAAAVYDALRWLPKRFREHPDLKGCAFDAMVLRARELELLPMNPRTANGYISSMSVFFGEEQKLDHIVENPFRGLRLKTHDERESDRGFTANERSIILINPLFMGSKHIHRPYDAGSVLVNDWHFWSVVIALTAGARIAEVAQLRPDDVRQEEGVWVFDINDWDEKRLKNAGSVRTVPIHSELISIGVLKLAEGRKKAGHLSLLPAVPKPVEGDPGKQLSKWMSEKFLPRLGIKRPGCGYHSFRHALRTMMRNAGIDHEIMDRIEGHKTQGVGARYGRHELKTLAQALERIEFPKELKGIPARL
jgi:integrase